MKRPTYEFTFVAERNQLKKLKKERDAIEDKFDEPEEYFG